MLFNKKYLKSLGLIGHTPTEKSKKSTPPNKSGVPIKKCRCKEFKK